MGIRKLALLGTLVVAAFGIAVLTYLSADKRPSSNSAETGANASTVLLPAHAPSASPKAINAATALGAARDNRYWIETRSSDLTSAFRRLSASSDPAAMATAGDIADGCSLSAGVMHARTAANIEAQGRKPAVMAAQKAMLAKLQSRCAGFTSDDLSAAAAMRMKLAEMNHPRSASMRLQFKDPYKSEALAKEAAQLQDPHAMMEVAGYLLNRPDLHPGHEFDIGGGIAVNRRTMWDAFLLATCDFGADCGPDHPFVIGQCINAGYCPSISLNDTFSQFRYSPAQMERLDAARQAIVRAIQSGEWPAGFWPEPRLVPEQFRKTR